ncbi:hypothetical protein Hamer_G024792, partial [Homarus americanus]
MSRARGVLQSYLRAVVRGDVLVHLPSATVTEVASPSTTKPRCPVFMVEGARPDPSSTSIWRDEGEIRWVVREVLWSVRGGRRQGSVLGSGGSAAAEVCVCASTTTCENDSRILVFKDDYEDDRGRVEVDPWCDLPH